MFCVVSSPNLLVTSGQLLRTGGDQNLTCAVGNS